MTEEIARMWADILSASVKGPRPGAMWWSVEVYGYLGKTVYLDTPKECFDAALAEREPEPSSY